MDEWELPKEDFTLEEQLGSGFFADVYRGRWRNHISVAVKILKSGTLSPRDHSMQSPNSTLTSDLYTFKPFTL